MADNKAFYNAVAGSYALRTMKQEDKEKLLNKIVEVALAKNDADARNKLTEEASSNTYLYEVLSSKLLFEYLKSNISSGWISEKFMKAPALNGMLNDFNKYKSAFKSIGVTSADCPLFSEDTLKSAYDALTMTVAHEDDVEDIFSQEIEDEIGSGIFDDIDISALLNEEDEENFGVEITDKKAGDIETEAITFEDDLDNEEISFENINEDEEDNEVSEDTNENFSDVIENESNNNYNSLVEKMKKTWGAKLSDTIKGIMISYDKLYEPGYGLVPPIGILTSKGIVRSYSDGHSGVTGQPAVDIEAYMNIVSVLGEKYTRYATKGEEPDIEKLMNTNLPVIYTDLHLKFMFGHLNFCANSSNRSRSLRAYLTKNNIKNDSDTKVIRYKDIKGWIKETIENYFYDAYIKMGVSAEVENIHESLATVNKINSILSSNLKNVIAVVEKKDGVNTKLRICSDENIDVKSIVSLLKSKLNTGSASLIDVEQVGKSEHGVAEVNIIYNQKAFSQDALFAYQVLDILKEQDIRPTWGNVILGKRDDGNIMTYNFKDSNNSVIGLYGSKGSGKGVMTLNLISSALADDCTLMYMDAKPDSAIPLCKVVWDKGLDAVIFNGKETPGASLERQGNCPRTVNRFIAKQQVPSGVFNTEVSLEKFILLNTYYRGLELFLDLAEDRASVVTNGGHNDNWLVAIFDEVQQLATTEDTIVQQLEAAQKARTKAKEEIDGKVKTINYMQDPIWKFIEEYKAWRATLVDRLATALGSTFRKAEVTSIYIWQTSDYPGSYKNTSIIAKALMQEATSVVKIMGRGAAAANGGSIVYGTKSNIEKDATWYDHRFSGKSGGYWAIGNNVNSDSGMTVFRPFNVYSNASDKELLVRNAVANGLTEQDLVGVSLNEDGTVIPEIGFEAYSDKLLAMSGKTAATQLNLGYKRIEQFIIEKGLSKSVCDYMYGISPTIAGEDGSVNSSDGPDLHNENSSDGPDLHNGNNNESDLNIDNHDTNSAQTIEDQKQYMNGVMSAREYMTKDQTTRQSVLQRIVNELPKAFTLDARGNETFGLKHLCYNLSIMYITGAYRKINIENYNPSIKTFCKTYYIEWLAGSGTDENGVPYMIDKLPSPEQVLDMARAHNIIINNLDGDNSVDLFSNLSEDDEIEPDSLNTSVDNSTDYNADTLNDNDFTDSTFEINDDALDNYDFDVRPSEDVMNRLNQEAQVNMEAHGRSSVGVNQDGSNRIGDLGSLIKPMKLTNQNCVIVELEDGGKDEKLFFNLFNKSGYNEKMTDSLLDDRRKAVINVIRKKWGVNGVRVIRLESNELYINGVIINTDKLKNADLGFRFNDIVKIEELLKTFRLTEKVEIDADSFRDLAEVHYENIDVVMALFKLAPKMRVLNVQFTPGPYTSITRGDLPKMKEKLKKEIGQAKFYNRMKVANAIYNPRLSEASIGGAHEAYKIAKGMGGNFVEALTAKNPKIFRSALYGAIGAGALVGGLGLHAFGKVGNFLGNLGKDK